MRMLLQILGIILAVIVVLAAVGWLGLQVKAASLHTVAAGEAPALTTLPLNLPEPVQRYARAVYSDALPVIHTAEVLGRASLAPVGMAMPSRVHFYYDADLGSHYHDIQVTWFTIPFMRIHERNLEGHGTLDLSILGKVEDQPKTNRAIVQGYWSELLAWLPSIVLTDPRVRWEGIDANSARLYLPGLDDVEALTVQFDAETGLLATVETMRYQDETREARWHWRNRILEWGVVDGMRTAMRSQTQWNDDAPWATWEIEQIALNVDVAPRLEQFGGDVTPE